MQISAITRRLVALPALSTCLLGGAAIGSLAGGAGKEAPATVQMHLTGAVHNVGELRMNTTNWGMLGSMPGTGAPFSSNPSAQWPSGAGIEYLFSGGIWVSTSTWSPRVSTGSPIWEFRPTPEPIDVIYWTAEGAPGGNRAAHPRADDDGDGLVNEEWPDARDNDGDGEIDEDYVAISDQMFACWYSDDQQAAIDAYPEHDPLHITIHEQSYQWADDDYDDCVGLQYEIQNTGTDILDDVYIGIMLDPDAGLRGTDNYWQDDLVAIDTVSVDHGAHGVRDYDFVYGYDADGDGGITNGCFGVVFLGLRTTAPGASPSGRVVTFAKFSSNVDPPAPTDDLERYALMSSGIIQRRATVPRDYQFLAVVGPVQGLRPLDTVTLDVAAVATPHDGTFANVKNAARLYFGEWFDADGDPATGIDGKEFQEHWFIPGDLPVRVPTLSAEPVHGGVKLEWSVDAQVALDGFQAVRRDPGGAPHELVGGLLVPSTRSFVDVTVTPGEKYEYAVWGYGVSGMPGRSDFVAVSVPPVATALGQNHPNPFNPGTTIPFTLETRQAVDLAVFDTSGHRVRTLLNTELDAGPHDVDWDGTDDNGVSVASGVYFCRLSAAGAEFTKKMMLLK